MGAQVNVAVPLKGEMGFDETIKNLPTTTKVINLLKKEKARRKSENEKLLSIVQIVILNIFARRPNRLPL
ncbi:hypothetical protein [Thalassobacillus sp. C254]|uniref:hypothetical protein n=1 Tax=Thalassobacillus sp. C254 TaxID=1225341 RepID=UPI0006CF4FA8|nr:hypothetical protein [Thalassobacillus sp. C254]